MIKQLLASLALLVFLQHANANLCVSFLNDDSSSGVASSVFENPYEGNVVEFEGFTFKTINGYDSVLSKGLYRHGEYMFRVIIYDSNEKVGDLEASCPAQKDGSPGNEAQFDLDLPKGLKDKGLATAFMKKFLILYPSVTTVDDVLLADNYYLFYKAKRNGLSNVEALGETPYGRILLKLGFVPTSIEPDYTEKKVDVVLQRNQLN